MRMSEGVEINAQITILANYDNVVKITVYDKDSGIDFLDIKMTHEQFVNATMNRLGNCNVIRATISDVDKLGKHMEIGTLEFEITGATGARSDIELARKLAKTKCDAGWVPDLDFVSSNSFFRKEGKQWARTTIRRWM